MVVKASGLAAGKGVTVCKSSAEAMVAVTECLEKRRFGEAGYPGEFKKGQPIFGLDRVATGPDLPVFHSGTVRTLGDDLQTAGGRVLSVTALGVDAGQARQRAYAALQQIEFAGMHYRKDIGLRA